jgi:phasin family protein
MATKTASRTIKASVNAFEGASAASADAVRENLDRGMAALSEMSAFGKQNAEAWLASAAATQKGLETLSARTVAFSKQAMENHVSAAKSLMASKSVQEFVEKQNAYAKSSFEAYVAEFSEISELASGLAKDAFQPLNDRISAVGDLIQTGAAR